MDDSYFLSLIVDGLSVSPLYSDESDRLFDIGMLRLLFEKLQIGKFIDEYDLTKEDYEKYFQGIMGDIDLSLKNELENEFRINQVENKMYKSETLNEIIECIENYEEAFMDRGGQLTVLGTFLLLVDKFNLDDFMSEYDFTPKEYAKYFQKTTKKHNKSLHKIIKKEFKNA